MSWITESLVIATTAFLAIAATPGPANVYIAKSSMQFGRRIGLLAVLGVLSGTFFWGVLIAHIITVAHSTFTPWTLALRIAGGLYLIWLAIRSIHSALTKSVVSEYGIFSSHQARRTYARGFLIQGANPNVVLMWIGTILIATTPATSSHQPAFLVVGICWVLSSVIYCGYALLFAHPTAAAFYESSRSKIEIVAAMLFGSTGLLLLTALE